MKIHKKENQKTIESKTCGSLVEVLNSSDFNTSIALATNLKSTTAHHHKISTETYWVLEGKIKVSINNVEHDLSQGDIVVISPNEIHQVVESSEENKIAVISNPRWTKEDEYI